MEVLELDSQRTKHLLKAFVVAAAILPFVNALGNGFTVDDAYLVVGNTDIRSLANIGSFFLGTWGGTIDSGFYGAMNAGYYRPISMTLYAFEHALFGYSPVCWRAVSILLHALNSLLVYSIATGVVGNPPATSNVSGAASRIRNPAALLAALVFAVHPVHSEVLNPATYQTTLLATLAVLCAVRLHIGPFTWLRAVSVSLALLAGMLSKENALSAPFLLPLYDFALRGNAPRNRFRLTTYALSGLVLIGYLTARASFLQGEGFNFFGDAPPTVVALTMLKVVVRYGQLLLFPVRLCPFYDWYVIPFADSLLDLEVLGGAVILVLVCIAVVVLWLGKRRLAAFGLAWTVFALLPVFQIVPMLNVAAERFLYLPSVGFCLFFASVTRWNGRYKRGFLVLLLSVFAFRTAARNPDWCDDVTLNLAFARDFPQTPTPHINLTRYYKRRGEYRSAFRHSEAARMLEPRLPGPWEDGVWLLIKLGRSTEAIELARKAKVAGISLELSVPISAPRPPERNLNLEKEPGNRPSHE
jgi:hypothetical protein